MALTGGRISPEVRSAMSSLGYLRLRPYTTHANTVTIKTCTTNEKSHDTIHCLPKASRCVAPVINPEQGRIIMSETKRDCSYCFGSFNACRTRERIATLFSRASWSAAPRRLPEIRDPELIRLGVLLVLIWAGCLLVHRRRSAPSPVHADQDSGRGRFGAEATAEITVRDDAMYRTQVVRE